MGEIERKHLRADFHLNTSSARAPAASDVIVFWSSPREGSTLVSQRRDLLQIPASGANLLLQQTDVFAL